jgi:hypothetical protein
MTRRFQSNEAEFRPADQRGFVTLLMPTDLDLVGLLDEDSLTIKQVREIVRERRRREELERKELAHEKHIADIKEALENEFGH